MPLGGSISLLLVSFEPFQWSEQTWGRFLFLNNWIFFLSFSFLFFLSFDMFLPFLEALCILESNLCHIQYSTIFIKVQMHHLVLFSSTSAPVEMDCIADMLYPYILFLHLSYMVYYLHAMLSGRVDPHLAVCNMLLENENHESEMPCGSFQLTKMSINNRVVHTGVYFSHLCANALPCS